MGIGLFCPSNRPHLWGDLIKTLSNNSVDWNLCIAGPYPPIEPLPGNVKYIQTNVKPAQCAFIAANNVEGDCIALTNDDLIFSPGCLDDMSKLLEEKGMIVASPFFMPGGDIKNVKQTDHYLFWDARGYPSGDSRATRENKIYAGTLLPLTFSMPLVGFIRKDTFNNIGIDKNFVGMWWPQDISMELVSKGGKVVVSKTSYCYDFRGGGDSLCRIACDLFYLDDMWVDQAIVGGADKKVRTTRKEPIDPLVYNDTVLTVSQGRVYPPLSKDGTFQYPRKKRKITPEWM